MKKTQIIIVLLSLLIGPIFAQDTIPHITSGCVYNEKSSLDELPCPPGVFFNYANDTLYIHGTIGANCCGTHFAVVQMLRDTLFIATHDTGDLCTCVCGFCFELKIPATNEDTIVCMNGISYNTKEVLSSVNQKEFDEVIQVLPNPFHNELRIRLNQEIIKSAIITDFSGKTIQSINSQAEVIVPTSSWPAGIYLINVRTSTNGLVTRKIIKE